MRETTRSKVSKPSIGSSHSVKKKRKHQKPRNKRVERTQDDILCNRCGCSCKCFNNLNYEGLLEAHVEGGFGARLGEGVRLTFSICEVCLEELFKEFKLPANRDK